MQTKNFIGRSVLTLSLLLPSTAFTGDRFDLPTRIKNHKDGILTLMSFTVLPDVTTSSLAINGGGNNDTSLSQTTVGGGFTVSKDFPLYLEGTVGYSRYSPTFIDKSHKLTIPVKWNSLSVSGGIGWDFPLTENKELKLRPIFNFTLGHIESDASILGILLLKTIQRSTLIIWNFYIKAE